MTIGTIKQYQGPFDDKTTLNLNGNDNCIIGISISEDDYMKLGSSSEEKSFCFTINGQQIWMGRTYRYQTNQQVHNTIIRFPYGAPPSTLVELVYCSED